MLGNKKMIYITETRRVRERKKEIKHQASIKHRSSVVKTNKYLKGIVVAVVDWNHEVEERNEERVR